MVKKVYLGDVPVGDGCPAVFMAEIGLYFNQDMGEARDTVERLKEYKVPVIKGEVLHDVEVALDDGFVLQYETASGIKAEPYRDMCARKVQPLDIWRKLYRLCSDANIPFVVSAYDMKTIDFLVDIGAAAVKISSTNLSHIPLIRHAGKSGLPVYLDSGKCDFADVAQAVRALQESGCEEFILNHNPDGHPAPPEDHNLRIIESYTRMFDCPVGLSCHYVGPEILYAAVGAGYHILEKPVIPDLTVEEWGTPWAMDLNDVPVVMAKVQDCSLARGNTFRTKRYVDSDHAGRMGIVAKVDLKPGDTFQLENVHFAFPNRGIVSRDFDRICGVRVAKELKAGEPVTWEHVGLVTSS